ncbi:Guanylate kinase [Planctomycetes bacterium Poly30]|uniref:Guanylate kinase n=2 Tax=Saltatorellus ferox TaxID=2528018 RepID=A0A518F073_9BACT|nr:Guanylate kinase [Planctomycetes bacterium Poly30]
MLLISGPSGCGKSTICKQLLESDDVVFSVSATTRAPRPGEVDGQHYHFLSPESFRKKITEGAFIEHAEVHGNMYGTLKEPMERAIADGKVYLVEIDVQGALQLKALEVDGIYVFVAPPDFEVLRNRLSGRGTETPEVLERRLKKAEDEYRERERYDHIVVNDNLERAVAEIRRISGLPEEPDAGSGGASRG